MDFAPQPVRPFFNRRNLEYPDGRFDEINLYAEGTTTEGNRELIVAEAKAHPGKRDADRFAALVERVAAHSKLPVHAVLVRSYEFELRYDRRKLS